ncbi:MAG: DUF1553 domain-containing protein [Undibacterium sp.]|nr:DUF1553 domain-containing protein [Opitutaceae bacterium]
MGRAGGVVSRGVLGLTVACARCHDHKFDPISTRGYCGLAGVFASTAAAPRSLTEVDAAVETRFMATAQRIFYLSYLANLLRDEPGSAPVETQKKAEGFVSDLDVIQTEIADLRERYPTLHAQLAKLERRPKPYPAVKEKRPDAGGVVTDAVSLPAAEEPVAVVAANETGNPPGAVGSAALAAVKDPTAPAPAPAVVPQAGGRQGRGRGGAADPYFHSVFEAGLWVDGTDPNLPMIELRPGVARDLRVLPGGNVAKPGEISPCGFPTVLAKGGPAFHHGSRRRELAEKLFTDAAPLAARVIVNRTWGWHYGRPLVETPSDFGSQGEKPTNPSLLDDLAARFIAHGWSLKWLHRDIMLSATYQQAGRLRLEAARIDPANRSLRQMNPRRLDVEAYRDCILQATGSLDPSSGGPSTSMDQADNTRRTVYARISNRASNLLQLNDFSEATMHSPFARRRLPRFNNSSC